MISRKSPPSDLRKIQNFRTKTACTSVDRFAAIHSGPYAVPAMSNPLLATDPARHASVHASAGTGKTWLLVTRMLRLLLAGAAPASILAVTFTRKAAAEMLERLNERLAALAAGDDATVDAALHAIGVAPDAALRARARRLYETLLFEPLSLRATTFHAFCQEILQRFPVEAEVPPGFELLEGDAELIDEAWDALYAEATRTPDGQVALALEILFDACGGLSGTRQAVNSFLAQRIDWWAFTRDHSAALEHAEASAREVYGIEPDSDPLGGFFSPTHLALLGEFAALLGKHENKTNLEQQQTLLAVLSLHEHPTAFDSAAALEQVTRVLLTQDGEPRKRKTSKALEKSLGLEGAARLLELHERLCAALLETRDQLARQTSLALTCAWYRAGQRLLEHYQRIKREQRVLDFADLEWHAYRLLNGSEQAHWVQYKLDARIDHFLIDEFQDTNPTQWRLLLPLLDELAAGGERARAQRVPGRRRQAVHLPLPPRRRAPAGDRQPLAGGASARGAFQPGILAPLRAGDHRLRQPRLRRRAAGRGDAGFPPHSTHLKDLWGQVELLPSFTAPDAAETVRAGLRNPLEEPRPMPADDLHACEARALAARIRALIDAPTLIGAADTARPLRYGDILILLRNRTHAASYEKALRDAGIPYLGAARGTLLDSLEVRDLEALLNTLIAPHDNLALAQVLRSPLFAASDAELIALAQGSGENWMQRLLDMGPRQADGAPLARAARLLPVWADLVGRLPVHDLLDRIYHEGDVLARFDAAATPALKPRVRANLIRFIELALEVDSGRYPSLPHFVARLGDLRQRAADAPDDAPPESGDGERVRFLTVHGAKGLEAPVVFLADCGGNGNRDRNAWQALVDWPAEEDRPRHLLLIGRKAERDSITRQLLERQQHAEQREDANLLYVALTRARQLLVVSAAVDADNAGAGWYGLLRAQWDVDGCLERGAPFVHATGTPPTAALLAPGAPPPAARHRSALARAPESTAHADPHRAEPRGRSAARRCCRHGRWRSGRPPPRRGHPSSARVAVRHAAAQSRGNAGGPGPRTPTRRGRSGTRGLAARGRGRAARSGPGAAVRHCRLCTKSTPRCPCSISRARPWSTASSTGCW
jgi:ATP-dependent helicase/nuclease subunit A